MYQGKHGNTGRAPRRPRSKRTLLAALALVLVLGLAIGGTIAYLFTETKSITNTFTPGSTTPEIDENLEGNTKTSIVIKNTGNVEAYIRVMLVGNTVETDDDGNEVVTGGFDVDLTNKLGSDWVLFNGYYYYTKPVAENKTTSNLLGTGVTIKVEKNQTVTVLAQSIQSVPASAVGDAWGVTIADGSVSEYTYAGGMGA